MLDYSSLSNLRSALVLHHYIPVCDPVQVVVGVVYLPPHAGGEGRGGIRLFRNRAPCPPQGLPSQTRSCGERGRLIHKMPLEPQFICACIHTHVWYSSNIYH